MIAGTYAGLRWGKFLPTARCGPLIPRASGFNGGIVFGLSSLRSVFLLTLVRLTACLCLLVHYFTTRYARGLLLL